MMIELKEAFDFAVYVADVCGEHGIELTDENVEDFYVDWKANQ